MKKLVKKIIAFSCAFSLVAIPFKAIDVKAETLRDFEKMLEKYQKEQANINDQIGEANSQTAASKKEIENIKTELSNMANEIQQMQSDIVDYDNQIREKTLQTKELFEYLQMTRSENAMLEYAFGASSITELVYRISAVKQIAEYNEAKIEELKEMIENNKKRGEELKIKEKEMEERQEVLTQRITELTKMKASLNSNSVSTAAQIKIYKDMIQAYKNQGCSGNMVIGVDCATTSSMAGWYRPVTSGYVTSEFGYRWGSLHRAVDISNANPYSTKIYPVANGTITAKFKDYYGALTIIIEHKTVNGKYYSSLYTHMSQYAPNVYVGKRVTTNDYIGYMGATGFANGPHLHLEIAPCRVFNQSDKNCDTWNKYTAYIKKLYDNGSFKGPRELIYFPKQWVKFNSRV